MTKFYTCSKCKESNLLSDEMRWSPRPSWCKKCHSKYRTEWYRELKKTESGRKRYKNQIFKTRYNITYEEFESILENQNNICLICCHEFNEINKPHIDHDHKTKKVRGILCKKCNLAIAYLHEDEDIIWNMLEYLKKTTWCVKQGESNVTTIQ